MYSVVTLCTFDDDGCEAGRVEPLQTYFVNQSMTSRGWTTRTDLESKWLVKAILSIFFYRTSGHVMVSVYIYSFLFNIDYFKELRNFKNRICDYEKIKI